MDSKTTSSPVGVIGGGSFGTAIANLISRNTKEVILYFRDPAKASEADKSRISSGQKLADNIRVTNDITEVGENCQVLFPAVPAVHFRSMMKELSPTLRPYHIIIHGTKGFDINGSSVTKETVRTMSQVIKEESTVVRVGCIAGPNLAREIAEGKPAATVVASPFEEVVEKGQKLLRNDNFLVYGGNDLIGTELCGILKNIIAVGSGLVDGLNFGENAKALLISRGLVEMIYIGQAFEADVKPFLGLAGVGDLIATCGSPLSRNYQVGQKIASGMKIDEIISSLDEVAEGIRTIETVYMLSEKYKFKSFITEMLYRVIYENYSIERAQTLLMGLPFRQEVDFID